MVIAIDGPSGSGKTSTAKLLAEKLDFYYCDSGSLYRAITYHLIEVETDLSSDFACRSISIMEAMAPALLPKAARLSILLILPSSLMRSR